MILNTHDPCESDLTVRTAPVFWLVSAHSAPGTAALVLSRTMARNELETFCAKARLAAQARRAINLENFFMEPPIMPATPVACSESESSRGPQACDGTLTCMKQLKRSLYPKSNRNIRLLQLTLLNKGIRPAGKPIGAGRRIRVHENAQTQQTRVGPSRGAGLRTPFPSRPGAG